MPVRNERAIAEGEKVCYTEKIMSRRFWGKLKEILGLFCRPRHATTSRQLLMLLLSFCTAEAIFSQSSAQCAPRVYVNIQGDSLEYDAELRTVAVRGNVRITARTDIPGFPTVSIAAEQLEGDINNGVLIAHGQTRLLSQNVALKGEELRLNFKTHEFAMNNGAAMAQALSPHYPGQWVRGFFFGEKLTQQANLIYIIEGRLTTCDRQRPDYCIGARKLIYDPQTQKLQIERGYFQLYGTKISLPVNFSVTLQEAENEVPWTLLPQYNTYEGLYWPIKQQWAWPEEPWKIEAYLHCGTALRFPMGLKIRHQNKEESFTFSVTRREQVIWDLNRRARLDRTPELHYTYSLRSGPAKLELEFLRLELFAGYLYEHLADAPLTEAGRAGLLLRYSPFPQRCHDKIDFWSAAELQHNLYSTGDHLTDLRLEAGWGRQFNERLTAALWGVHHETAGQSPFAFDDVYAQNEGFVKLAYQLNQRHRLELLAHYDFERHAFRNYTLKISQREHCLTWHLEYDFAQQSVSVGVDINGLTGGTAPVSSQPLVQPEEVPPLPEPVPAPSPLPGFSLKNSSY